MKWIAIFTTWIYSVYSIEIKNGGLIPSYKPYEIGIMLLFLPYNPTVIAVGDRIADFTSSFARARDRANIHGFTADADDFERLGYFGREFPNINPYFGLLNDLQEGAHIFYSTLSHEIPDAFYYHFAGSMLKPTDVRRPFLFGSPYQVPSFNFLNFCKSQNLKKIHLIYLDCGGNELKILESISDYLKTSIVVFLKTYHQEIRAGISPFQPIHELMTNQGYELLSHYIYDSVIGDAMYVKSKYVSAVFRSKEI